VKQRLIRSAALAGAAALTVMTASPGYAATIVSQSSANALTISLDGNDADSGTVTATNDGTGETKTGETNPPIAVLGNQDLLDIGVLAQEAEAKMSGKGGVSAACSGIAGDGGSVVTIGESGCLTPGSPIGVSLANLDLTGVEVTDPASALGPLAELNPVLEPILGQLTAPISAGLESALGPLELGGTFGTVQAFCNATPGSATGRANIADTTLGFTFAEQSVNVATLPVNPPPNTHVLTDLRVVVTAILDAVRTDLDESLNGAGAPLNALPEALQDEVVDTLIAEVAPQLAPLEENVLDVVLNKQTHSPANSIQVTAIDLQLLPAAAKFIDGPLLGLEIANVTCGPNGRVTDNPGGPIDPGLPDVPTVVDSGTSGAATAENDAIGDALAAGLLLLAGAATMIGYRRRMSR
jgi:hypothetical protein